MSDDARSSRPRSAAENGASRRHFLQWLGLAPGAAALGLAAACREGDALTSLVGDSGLDADLSLSQDSQPFDGAIADIGEVVEPACELTGSDVRGPFHLPNAPFRAALAGADEPGDRLHIEGVVFGPDCETPLAGALLDVWHADKDGQYHDDSESYRLRGQMMTDDRGRFAFDTVRPGNYPMAGSMRPAHVHFTVSAPSHVPVTTQLYFAGDPFLSPSDPCTTCSSGDATLIIELERSDDGGRASWAGRFDIVLDRASR